MELNHITQQDNAQNAASIINDNFDTIAQAIGESLDSGEYIGERIRLEKHWFKRTLMQTLPDATVHQSMAIYGDYCLLAHSNGTAQLYNIKTNTRIGSVSIPAASGFNTPHANVAQFGVEFASGNSAMPLLYLSQWDGQHGFIAYNLTSSGTMSLVQTIKPNVSAEVFGEGQTDWVIDTDGGWLYSLAYKQANEGYLVTEENGGRTMVCKFKLPKIADGSAIVLTDADVVDHYELPPINVRQDACYVNGHILLVAGGGSSSAYQTSWNKLYSIDLLGKCISSIVDIYGYLQVEPEGLSIYDGKLIMTYLASNYGRLFSYEF